MSIEIQCMTEKLIVITIKLDYSKVPSKSTVPTSAETLQIEILPYQKLILLNVNTKRNRNLIAFPGRAFQFSPTRDVTTGLITCF